MPTSELPVGFGSLKTGRAHAREMPDPGSTSDRLIPITLGAVGFLIPNFECSHAVISCF